MNHNLTKLNLGFKGSKLLRTKLNCKLMKLNEEVTKMGGKTYTTFFSSYSLSFSLSLITYPTVYEEGYFRVVNLTKSFPSTGRMISCPESLASSMLCIDSIENFRKMLMRMTLSSINANFWPSGLEWIRIKDCQIRKLLWKYSGVYAYSLKLNRVNNSLHLWSEEISFVEKWISLDSNSK